jgi:hypothetical protein
MEVRNGLGSLENAHGMPFLYLVGQQWSDANTNDIVFVPGHERLAFIDWVFLLLPMVQQEVERFGVELVHFKSLGQLYRTLIDLQIFTKLQVFILSGCL